MRRAISLDDKLVTRARKFGIELARWYANEGKHSRSRSRSGDRGAESNSALLGLSKAGEAAAALFFGLDPDVAVKWAVDRADNGSDLHLLSGQLIDVKATESWKRYVIWSRDVNDLYWSKVFDFIIGVSVDDNDWSRCWIEGCISKQDFFDLKQTADGTTPKGLQSNTWFIEKTKLFDATALMPAHFDAAGHFIHHCCKCARWGAFSIDYSPRNNMLGTWFCRDHRPKQYLV